MLEQLINNDVVNGEVNVEHYVVVVQIEYCEDKEKIIEDEQDAEGGWVDTHHYDNVGLPTVEEKVFSSFKNCKATLNKLL